MSPKKIRVLSLFPSSSWVWPLFFLALWEILLLAQNPGLMADDSGEMIAGSYRLGLPHPPGYPLFCLMGRLFSLVPVGTVAFRFNLFSALVGLAALGFVMASCGRLAPAPKGDGKRGIRLGALLLAGLSLFFCRSFFSQCLTAKGLVYMLSFLLLSALVDLRIQSQTWSDEQKSRKKNIVLFLFFLGFANHWQTQALLTPFILLWGFQERTRWGLKSVFRSVSMALIAFSAYLYLPLEGSIQAFPKWGNPVTWREFAWVVRRKLVSNREALFPGTGHLWKWILEYGRLMVLDWTWPLLLAGMVGVVYWMVSKKKLFLAAVFFYFPMLGALVSVPREETIYLLNTYLLSLQGLFAVFVFLGISALWDRMKRLAAWGPPLFGVLLSLVLAWNAAAVLKSEPKTNYTLMEDFGLNALKNLPSRAVFVMDGDHYVMPIWYERYVEGFRKDLVIEPGVFLFHPWGWEQLERMDPEVKKAAERFPDFPGKCRALADIPGRPLFCSLSRNNLGPFLGQFPGSWAPQGLVLRYEGASPKKTDLEWGGASAERIRDFDGFKDSPGLDFSSNEIFRYYARQYYEAAQYFHGKKRDDSAILCFAQGAKIYPEAFALGDLGLLLEQEGFGALAEAVWDRGLQVDPNYYPTYFNLAKFYQRRGEKQKALDRCQRALALAPHSEKARLELLESELNSKEVPVSVSPRAGRTALDYQKLARRLDRDGVSWLAKLALAGAAPVKSGNPRK